MNEMLSEDVGVAMQSLQDKNVIDIRHNIAELTAIAFIETALEIEEMFPFEQGIKNTLIDNENLIEETKAICLIMRIAGDISQSANLLYKNNNTYSASALVRQIVEVEYLAWAFDNDSIEAKKWIHSSKSERLKYFTPAKLRKAAQNRFRSEDYGYHCELGGHPVPRADILLNNKNNIAQLMLSDMIGHTWRIWDHLVQWTIKKYNNHPIMRKSLSLVSEYDRWKEEDKSTNLPPP